MTSTSALAVAGPSPLWYLSRGTGLVALILLTASVGLGVLSTGRWDRPSWPRFATAGLHRNLSMLVVVLLAAHIVTAELDTFAPIGWLAVALPFASPYRPIWLGLGTLAFELIVAVIVTSLLRQRLGYRTWRIVHWAAYGSWPVALVHGLGTGTDARLGWVQFTTCACAAVVIAAGAWRLAHRSRSGSWPLLAGGTAMVTVAVVVGAWAVTGPMRPGWARRAGTPPALLATTPTPASPQSTTPPAMSHRTANAKDLPTPPFSAAFTGSLSQAGPDLAGRVTVTISGRLSGGATGTMNIVLRGQAADGGVALASSAVTFGPDAAPNQYRGTVVALNGDQLVAAVASRSGPALDLGVNVQLDPASASCRGTVTAQVASSSPGAASPGDGDRDGDR